MKIFKNYNGTKIMEENKKKLFSYADDESIIGVYVSMDIFYAHVYRIVKGYNEEYEKEDGTYLIEQENIHKSDVVEKILKLRGRSPLTVKKVISNRIEVNKIINNATPKEVIWAALSLDNDNGLETYRVYECHSLEDAIELIDDGYGIIEI